jgi:hypothetical protein
MIVDSILSWWFGFCHWLISLFPTNPMPQGVNLGWISDMNYFLPISEMFGLFTIFFAFGGPFAGASLIIWIVVGIVRGGSTKA